MSIQTIAKRNTNETVQANFRLPKSLLEDLKRVAKTESVSATLIVDAAVRAALEQYRQTNKLNLQPR